MRGAWWRTFGLIVLANLAAFLPGVLLSPRSTRSPTSSDRAVWSLVGTMATETITAPFVALFSTLLYYDLKARSATRACPEYGALGHRVLAADPW